MKKNCAFVIKSSRVEKTRNFEKFIHGDEINSEREYATSFELVFIYSPKNNLMVMKFVCKCFGNYEFFIIFIYSPWLAKIARLKILQMWNVEYVEKNLRIKIKITLREVVKHEFNVEKKLNPVEKITDLKNRDQSFLCR